MGRAKGTNEEITQVLFASVRRCPTRPDGPFWYQAVSVRRVLLQRLLCQEADGVGCRPRRPRGFLTDRWPSTCCVDTPRATLAIGIVIMQFVPDARAAEQAAQ
jgi:hypothetical protein